MGSANIFDSPDFSYFHNLAAPDRVSHSDLWLFLQLMQQRPQLQFPWWATSLSTLPAFSTVSEVEAVAVMVAPPAAARLAADLTICLHQTLAAQEAATPRPAQPVVVPPPHIPPLLILPTPSQ